MNAVASCVYITSPSQPLPYTHPGNRRAQLIKLTQKKCSSSDPKTKSAKARSCEMLWNSTLFSGFVCMRRLAVSTNWPTVALKPERKALKGCGVGC
jgi:hypothetical protein